MRSEMADALKTTGIILSSSFSLKIRQVNSKSVFSKLVGLLSGKASVRHLIM